MHATTWRFGWKRPGVPQNWRPTCDALPPSPCIRSSNLADLFPLRSEVRSFSLTHASAPVTFFSISLLPYIPTKIYISAIRFPFPSRCVFLIYDTVDIAEGERIEASNSRFFHPSAIVHPNAIIGEVLSPATSKSSVHFFTFFFFLSIICYSFPLRYAYVLNTVDDVLSFRFCCYV